MSLDKDSHIQRKFGQTCAVSVMNKVKSISKFIFANETRNSKSYIRKLDEFLKRKFINPGTCADLTVTTLLIYKITDIVINSNLNKY